MYEIYTQTRPGSPRWATITCAALLLVSLVLAAWLSVHKRQGTPIPLHDQSEFFPTGHLRIRMPAQWDRGQSEFSEMPGIVAVTHDNAASSGTIGKVLIVFRGIPRLNGIPSIDAAESLRQMAGGPDPTIETRSEPAQLNGLPGWSLELSPVLEKSRLRIYHLGQACLAPDGQIAGVWLTLSRSPTAEDRRLIEGMSASLELTDLLVTDDSERIMGQAGITFTPPADARFYESPEDRTLPWPRLRLTGGQGQKSWYLTAARVPLIGSRSPRELVEEQARMLAERIELSQPVQTATINDHPVFWTQVALPTNDRPTLLVWGAHVDDHTALLLVGRFESDGDNPLRAAAEAVTAGSITSFASDLDIDKAQATARECLSQLAADGLNSYWAHQSTDNMQTMAPAFPLRNELRRYNLKQAKDGLRWWQLDIDYLPPNPMIRFSADVQEQWSIRDDAATHAGRYREKQGRRIAVNYTELRPPGKNQVYCEFSLDEKEPASWTIDVDDTYACEPVLLVAGAKVARDPQKRPAIFSSSSTFCTRPLHWIMLPLGERPLPDTQPARTAPAVCMIRDCSPMPLFFFYNQDNSLCAFSIDDVLWQKPAPQEAATNISPQRRGRSR